MVLGAGGVPVTGVGLRSRPGLGFSPPSPACGRCLKKTTAPATSRQPRIPPASQMIVLLLGSSLVDRRERLRSEERGLEGSEGSDDDWSWPSVALLRRPDFRPDTHSGAGICGRTGRPLRRSSTNRAAALGSIPRRVKATTTSSSGRLLPINSLANSISVCKMSCVMKTQDDLAPVNTLSPARASKITQWPQAWPLTLTFQFGKDTLP